MKFTTLALGVCLCAASSAFAADYTAGTPVMLSEPHDFGSWTTINMPKDAQFAKLKEGDKIALLLENLGEDPMVQVAFYGPGWAYTEYFTTTATDPFEFVIDDKNATAADFLAGLQSAETGLMCCNGQNCTITGFQPFFLEEGGDNNETYEIYQSVTLDEPVAAAWDAYNIDSKYFVDLQEGDKFTLYVTDVTAEAQIQIACFIGAWSWVNYIEGAPLAASATEFSFIVEDRGDVTAAEFINGLQTMQGMKVQGQGFKITGFDIARLETGEDKPEYEEGDPINLDEPVTLDWTNLIKFPAANFADIKAGDKVQVLVSDVKSGAQLQLAYTYPDWSEFLGNALPVLRDDYFEFTIEDHGDFSAEALIAGLKEDGLCVNGYGVTVTGMKILSLKESDGIQNITATESIDANAPCEIYTIQGIRVSEMTPGNIYIVRQGNTVKKLVK